MTNMEQNKSPSEPRNGKHPFHNLTTPERSKFSKNYQKSNKCSRMIYTWTLPIINKVNAQNGKMNVEDIEDLNRSDAMDDMYKTDPEKASNIQTEESFTKFKELFEAEV